MWNTVAGWIGAVVIVVATGWVLGSMIPAIVRRWPKPRGWQAANRFPDAGHGDG